MLHYTPTALQNFYETVVLKSYNQLNDGQKKAYDMIAHNHSGLIFFITGSPGTGKTFLAKALLNLFEYNKYTVEAIAPSHKAKKVLSDSLGIDATTVARYCGYTMDETDNPVVNDEGEFVKTQATSEADMVIVDEISMVSDENFQEIIESAKIGVIALGDKNQLEAINTVSADLSSAITLELTEQMRQDNIDTALYKNIQLMKRKIEGSAEPVIFEYDETFEVSENLVEEYLENQVDIIVSYRNIFVDAYNEAIQQELKGTKLPTEGDSLLLNKPMFSVHGMLIGTKMSYPILANNGDMIIIKKIHKTQPKIGMIVELEGVDDMDATRLLLTRENWAERGFVYALWESKWKPLMKWKKFKKFALNASLPYAVTTHKVQGSTYENVGINVADINQAWKLNDKYRMLYVAMSRASKRCLIRK